MMELWKGKEREECTSAISDGLRAELHNDFLVPCLKVYTP